MIFKSYYVEENIGILKNNYSLFYGENTGLIDDFKNKILNKNKNGLIRFTQEEILNDTHKLIEEINNISLFDEEKIFFIDGVNDKMMKVSDILLNSKDNKFFLFAGILEKKSLIRKLFEQEQNLNIIPCYKDNDLAIRKIITKDLQGYRGMNTNIINTLINNTNNDRTKLKNEIEKIKTCFLDKEIKTNILFNLLNYEEIENFNAIKDSAIKGDNLKTNSLLSNWIFEREKSSLYLSTINQRLEKIKEILTNQYDNLEKIIDQLKPPIFWKDKPTIIKQVKLWNAKKINEALKKTYDIEIKLKTNPRLNIEILIKKLVIDICILANAT